MQRSRTNDDSVDRTTISKGAYCYSSMAARRINVRRPTGIAHPAQISKVAIKELGIP
jgi:hypothetical protein